MHNHTPRSAGTPEWRDALQQALPDANVPTLLMVLVHLTGDRKWLAPRYQCSYIRGIDDNDSGGLEDAVRSEICAAACDAIVAWKAGRPPALNAPDAATLVEMLSLSVGEKIPDAYGKMIAAGLGQDPELAIEQNGAFEVPKGYCAVIIGAGVAGLCAAIRFKGAGIPFTLIEKNNDVGGTWYENRYPGAGVDTPNHIYSYSFAKQDWTRYFALREEIQTYFEDVATRFGVRSHIRFNTQVESARYNEDTRRWAVNIQAASGDTETLQCDVLISAVGLLNVPKMPAIEGLERFTGACFHTARWPQDFDVTGKRVAVIGNGASAMQVVPAIVDRVPALTVFQRSKQWAAPFDKFQKPVPLNARFLLREVPFYQEWYRQRLAYIFNDRIHASLQKDPEWPHPERAINKTNDRHRAYFTDYIKAQLGPRQDLLPDVLPDYPPFGKRMLMDNGWYRTMARDHVHLVTGSVTRIEGDTLITDSGDRHQADALIIATGFDAINMLASFKLYGRGGRSVRQAWDENGAEAFMGVAIPGFPNFFMLAGPNTALGHGGSVVTLLETQVSYVLNMLRQAMHQGGPGFELEVRRDRHDAFNTRVQAAHERMIWTHTGMSNWYRNAQGRIVATTPFRNDDYWHMARRASLDDYVLEPARLAPRDASLETSA